MGVTSGLDYKVYEIPLGIYTIGGACTFLFGIIVLIITYVMWRLDQLENYYR